MNESKPIKTTLARGLLIAIVSVIAACGRNTGFEEKDWPATDTNTVSIDHSLWQQTLNAYLLPEFNAVNRVDYAGLKADGMPMLDAYLSAMASVDLASVSRNEQMAYWINVYNAVTFKVIAEAWPVESILALDSGSGPWDRALFENNQRELSLNDNEHRLLRGLWQEPRIHFAVNCASIGCPDVQPIAFTGINLEHSLALAARNFLKDPRAVRRDGGTLQLSSLFDWYADDFGGDSDAVRRSLAGMADEPTAALLRAPANDIVYAYDWDINAKTDAAH